MSDKGVLTMKKHPEVTMATKEKIRNSFWQLYCENGISTVSVCQVAKKAGVNRSTFYQYFIDIYDVLEQIENSLLDDLTEDLKNEINKGLPNSLKDLSVNSAHIFAKYSDYLVHLLGYNGDPRFSKKLQGVFLPLIKNVIGLDESEQYFEYIVTFSFSSIINMLTHWYESGQKLTYEELTNVMQSLIATGVLGLTNKKLFKEQM